MSKKVIYYEDELNDEFSTAKITPIVIDKNYDYFKCKDPKYDKSSLRIQNIWSMPIKWLYVKLKFHHKIVGKEKFKDCIDTGYFIYANHTQAFADTFIPSLANYPKRNFLIVNPENISMPHMESLVEKLGAIPVPGDKESFKNFFKIIEERIKQGCSITIYPEAHIWPYYTKIRNFKDVSFKYPVKYKVPVYSVTNTYQKGWIRTHITSFVDGPYFVDEKLSEKEAQKALRDEVYTTMRDRSLKSNYEKIEYKKKEFESQSV